jgi:putative transposase
MDNGAQKGVHEKDKRWPADALAGIQADSDTTGGARRATIGSCAGDENIRRAVVAMAKTISETRCGGIRSNGPSARAKAGGSRCSAARCRAGAVGRTTTTGDRFFRTGLASSRSVEPQKERRWRNSIFEVIEEKQEMQGGLKIFEMCQLAGVSRASYYRGWKNEQPQEERVALRDRLQRLALKHRYYGYRSLTKLLKREGWLVNHKRVLRIMRQDNLLSLRRKKFVITTQSGHGWHVYPNLARWMIATAINQLWVADITYVRLRHEFVYVAIILDVYSRRVVGWSIGRHLDSGLAQQALRQAVEERRPQPGLIHHSDQGWQYACGDYIELLEQHHIEISMSRRANPYDNAYAESFMKTLKTEEVDRRQYRSLEEAATSIGAFINDFYNAERLHSALGYRSPAEFEAQFGGRLVETAAADGNPRKQDSHSGLKPSVSQLPQAR